MPIPLILAAKAIKKLAGGKKKKASSSKGREAEAPDVKGGFKRKKNIGKDFKGAYGGK